MPVIAVLDDLEMIKPEQINDPWDFFRELQALRRYDYHAVFRKLFTESLTS